MSFAAMHCPLFGNQRKARLRNISDIDITLQKNTDSADSTI